MGKQIGELTEKDIMQLAEVDPIIHSCFKAFDVTTQAGWETALITALYFKSEACRVLAEELLEHKIHSPPPVIHVKGEEMHALKDLLAKELIELAAMAKQDQEAFLAGLKREGYIADYEIADKRTVIITTKDPKEEV